MSRALALRPVPALLAALLAALLGPAAASARPAAQGLYAEAGAGPMFFLGDGGDASGVGPQVGVRIGYDLFSWFSVGVNLSASTHEATVPPPPEGEYFQLYNATGDARLGFRHEWLALFVQGGGGVAAISSNILDKVGIVGPTETFSAVARAGLGVEYQLQNRHYALGIDGEWTMYLAFDDIQAVTIHAFVRYTYGGSGG